MNKSKQRGYMGIGRGWAGFLITLMLTSAVIGWGVIEGILWVFSLLGWCDYEY